MISSQQGGWLLLNVICLDGNEIQIKFFVFRGFNTIACYQRYNLDLQLDSYTISRARSEIMQTGRQRGR